VVPAAGATVAEQQQQVQPGTLSHLSLQMNNVHLSSPPPPPPAHVCSPISQSIIIDRITSLARPSVCTSFCLSVCHIRLLTRKRKSVEKPQLAWTIPSELSVAVGSVLVSERRRICSWCFSIQLMERVEWWPT